MAVYLEPEPGQAFQKFRGVVLDGQQYNLTLRWNDTDQSWYLDVRSFQDEPIALGLRVVLGVYIGRQSTHPLFRRGAFVAVDSTKSGTEAGFNDLGPRVSLSYWLYSDLLNDLVSDISSSTVTIE